MAKNVVTQDSLVAKMVEVKRIVRKWYGENPCKPMSKTKARIGGINLWLIKHGKVINPAMPKRIKAKNGKKLALPSSDPIINTNYPMPRVLALPELSVAEREQIVTQAQDRLTKLLTDVETFKAEAESIYESAKVGEETETIVRKGKKTVRVYPIYILSDEQTERVKTISMILGAMGAEIQAIKNLRSPKATITIESLPLKVRVNQNLLTAKERATYRNSIIAKDKRKLERIERRAIRKAKRAELDKKRAINAANKAKIDPTAPRKAKAKPTTAKGENIAKTKANRIVKGQWSLVERDNGKANLIANGRKVVQFNTIKPLLKIVGLDYLIPSFGTARYDKFVKALDTYGSQGILVASDLVLIQSVNIPESYPSEPIALAEAMVSVG